MFAGQAGLPAFGRPSEALAQQWWLLAQARQQQQRILAAAAVSQRFQPGTVDTLLIVDCLSHFRHKKNNDLDS